MLETTVAPRVFLVCKKSGLNGRVLKSVQGSDEKPNDQQIFVGRVLRQRKTAKKN